MIVLDTSVVPELMRALPAPAVLTWLRQNSGTGLCTTAVTVAEIRYGIARLPEGRRRESLHQAANEIFAAICRSHAATLATRNIRDFAETGIDTTDPWRE
jgi:predicted nucleic acid-binding protein